MKVQFDKSQYSSVGRSSCLVCVRWMKNQSRTLNPCLFPFMYSSCALLCVIRVCACVCVCVCAYLWMSVCVGGYAEEDQHGSKVATKLAGLKDLN